MIPITKAAPTASRGWSRIRSATDLSRSVPAQTPGGRRPGLDPARLPPCFWRARHNPQVLTGPRLLILSLPLRRAVRQRGLLVSVAAPQSLSLASKAAGRRARPGTWREFMAFRRSGDWEAMQEEPCPSRSAYRHTPTTGASSNPTARFDRALSGAEDHAAFSCPSRIR
jgi:hypothetical protein